MFFKPSPSHNRFVPEIITKDWLNDLLGEQNTLTSGSVTSVVLKRRFVHHHSDILFLQAQNSCDIEPNLPEHWVLKIRTHFEGTSEVQFYQQAALSQKQEHLSRAGAFKLWDSGESVLLLENLQHTHKLVVTDNQVFNQFGWRPTCAVLEQLIQAIALFHGRWWNAPELSSLSFSPWNYEDILNRSLVHFKAKERPDDAVTALLEQAVHDISLFQHRTDQSQVTLVHGDCFPWHFFLGREGGDVKLFDFEFAMVHSPAYDLVSLLSYWQGDYLKWVRRYHDALVSAQVTDYSFNHLLADIKLAVSAHTLRVIFDWHRGCSEALWKPRLGGVLKILQAVDNHKSPK